MQQAPTPSAFPYRGVARILVPLGVLWVAGWTLLAGPERPPLLAAGTGSTMDSDRDGVPDAQEVILWSDPNLADTDLDGFSDGEELAYQTHLTLKESLPSALGLSLGMTARGEPGKVVFLVVAHTADSDWTNKVLRLGALVDGTVINVPVARLVSQADMNTFKSPNGGALFTMEVPLPLSVLRKHGRFTLFGALGVSGTTQYAAAAKVDVVYQEGFAFLRREPPVVSHPSANQLPGTTIHQPIPPPGGAGIPIDWSPGQICYQVSQPVGSSGAVVQYEIVEAGCEEGWDSYCDDTDCSNSVGGSYDTIDPGVLLGG